MSRSSREGKVGSGHFTESLELFVGCGVCLQMCKGREIGDRQLQGGEKGHTISQYFSHPRAFQAWLHLAFEIQ